MNRRNFDLIVSSVGALLTGVLIVAAAGLYWGHTFVDDNVRDQLAAQQIYFPEAGSPALASDEIGPYLNKYAGQQLVNGAQAEAYANHYIAVHLKATAGGKTYAEVSTLSRQAPDDTKLAGQVQTLFRGETLRGLLLTAYGFWKMGQLALIGSIAALALAVVLGLLTILGFRHVRKATSEDKVLAPTMRPAVTH